MNARPARFVFRLTTLFAVLAMAGMMAASTADAAKKKRHPGKRLYLTSTCIACHGKNGKKAIMTYPNLAGQDEKYLVAQIKDIMKGKRKGSKDATGNPRSYGMRGVMVTPEGKERITSEQIKTIANWLANMEPAKPTPPKEPFAAESVAAGKKLFKKKCKVCHGKEGKKPKKGYPYVAGQKRSYLVTQMLDMKSKARKSGKSNTMFPVIKKIKDADIESLADYLSQIDRTAK